MPRNLNPRSHFQGQTLISLLIALGVFAILSHAIFTLTTSSFKTVGFSRARIAARHIAEEKIETIRNMPFEFIGTTGGIPSGPLPQTESRQLNGLNYTIKISIVYIDDPFDLQSPNDILPTDYKRARVEVSWGGAAASSNNPIVLTTDISPKGIESATGGGTLSILVFDSNAEPVSQAEVNIVSNGLTPAINITQNTNDNGRMVIPGIPECQECYNITVTKSGYSTDKTYTTSEVANPTKPPISIVEGALTETSFAIDKYATINISTVTDRESGFTPIPNSAFIIRGEKIIGTDIYDYPVYKFQSQFSTSTSGNLTITDVEWDNYTISLPTGSLTKIATLNPLNPNTVFPDTQTSWILSLVDNSQNSLLLIFKNPLNELVASESAHLTNNSGFDQEKVTGGQEEADFGQVFFNNITSGIYSLTATSSAYVTVNKDITVSGSTQDEINLEQNP